MKIKWVNHASYIFSYKSINLMTDPWLEGRVFNESWELLSKTALDYSEFKDITHIWFSHEHPDHFFPPNLKKIPKEFLKNITVLFQTTRDKKVKKYCEQLGFKEVIELDPFREHELSDGVKIVCSKVKNDTDSWLFLKTDEVSFLNVNDCIFETAEELTEVSKAIGGSVDVLFTQFSYASWAGNPDDTELKQLQAKEKLSEIKNHITYFKPKYTIPFASYIWFCNEANFHMNGQVNKIADIYNYLNSLGTRPVILFPGDEWSIGSDHDSAEALLKYEHDFKNINARALTKFKEVSFEELSKSADKYINKTLEKNNKRKLMSYKPFFAYLTDHDRCLAFSFKNGLEFRDDLKKEDADIAFHSQNLKYCFDFEWGWDTILVAGTFEKPKLGDFNRFMEYQWIGRLNNQGRIMKGLFGRLLERFANFN